MKLGLGERLRLRARELGLPDAEVARRLGLSQSRYAHYVSGVREPDFATFIRVCQALKITPDEALGFSTRREKPETQRLLRERCDATLEIMTEPTLRTAAALLDALIMTAGPTSQEPVEPSKNKISADKTE